MVHLIHCRRIYMPPTADDGMRILVERLWPRGIRKADAAIDLWLKVIAPSRQLRQWYRHDPMRWTTFQEHYRDELDANSEPVSNLLHLIEARDVTLVYAARDVPGNSAKVLQDYLYKLIQMK
ncbi:MAG: DUF488 family protein [Candidatus Thiodiazotropha sp. (ex Cardiolucina cf. quadrata)]|nr:DUF488 family protein [Candidatus Thiodiazotropha sp. (ex Cardiolucina cf. quadrata)]